MYRLTHLIFLFLACTTVSNSQLLDSTKFKNTESNWFVSVNCGLQMSGIKDEDFKGSNYTPLFNVTFGKWFLPHLGLQIGYKGFYFNTISDNIKHHYHYLYGEMLLHLNNAVDPARISKSWALMLHGGLGYFYNQVYGKPNICVNTGFQNTFKFSKEFQVSFDISSIIGWDIYQGDEDILPGVTVGLVYQFN